MNKSLCNACLTLFASDAVSESENVAKPCDKAAEHTLISFLLNLFILQKKGFYCMVGR